MTETVAETTIFASWLAAYTAGRGADTLDSAAVHFSRTAAIEAAIEAAEQSPEHAAAAVAIALTLATHEAEAAGSAPSYLAMLHAALRHLIGPGPLPIPLPYPAAVAAIEASSAASLS